MPTRTVFFVLMRRTQFWSLWKHFTNTLYIKNSWEWGDEDFILIKVGGAMKHNAMLHDYPACQLFPERYNCLRPTQLNFWFTNAHRA